MKSLYSFIVKPLEKRYDNVRKIGDVNLIINTGIEDHQFISKKAVVVSTPAAFKTHSSSYLSVIQLKKQAREKLGQNVYLCHFNGWQI